jgi:hypothetical protein
MRTLGQKIGFVLITCAAVVLAGTPAKAATTTAHDASSDVGASQTPQGVKGRTVAKAVVLVAKGIRKGNVHVAVVLKFLDKNATEIFLKNASRIADVLDDIAKIPDLVYSVVGQKLLVALTSDRGPFKLSSGTANTIVQGVMGAVSAAL